MYKVLITSIASSACLVLLSLQTAGQRPDNAEEFMRAKLVHAQRVLEGLSLENYDAVTKHSQEMTLISQAASWQVLQTAQYHQYSGEFRSATRALTEASKKQDLDAAAMAYVAMTLKCINCHKYVRRVRTARSDLPIETLFAGKENSQRALP